jgi:GNAT superfamily N-acetyltransferase
MHSIAPVESADLGDVFELMRAYCDFYEASPREESLLRLAHALLADPERAGVQLIARDERGAASGFASLFWSFDTLEGGEIGVMNDLFVIPRARGMGLGMRLIEACIERCSARGLLSMAWQTAPENAPAQRLYDRLGARREEAIVYSLALPSA